MVRILPGTVMSPLSLIVTDIGRRIAGGPAERNRGCRLIRRIAGRVGVRRHINGAVAEPADVHIVRRPECRPRSPSRSPGPCLRCVRHRHIDDLANLNPGVVSLVTLSSGLSELS